MPSAMRFVSIICFVLLITAEPAFAEPEAAAKFKHAVEPILRQNCYRCHGERKQAADLRLDTLNPDLNDRAAAETWHDVLNKLNLGEMPPANEPQLSAAARSTLVDWVTAEFKRTEAIRSQTGGRVVLRRLNRYEYQNTMRDLLEVNADFAGDLPPEPTSADGFQNNGQALGMSALQLEYYLKAARAGLAKAIVTGPEPEVHRQTFTETVDAKPKTASKLNRLEGAAKFLSRMDAFPRTGEIRVTVRARAEVPEAAGHPRLQVTLGVRSDTLAPERILGEADVSSADVAEFEFRGRIEEFPLPGHNPKFPGLLITARNVYDGGKPAMNDKPKGKKQQPAQAVDPTQPVIVIESLEFVGPIFTQWPPESHTQILVAREADWDDAEYARRVLARFMTRAFRRPVTDAELAAYHEVFQKLQATEPSFEAAIRETLALVLISPEFLYLVEYDETNEPRLLNDYELASRLSYFLWSTMPDDELFALAAGGELHKPAILAEQTTRMLTDARVEDFVRHFTDQWLNLSGIDRVAINPEYYPDFDDGLKPDMRRETQEFFAEVLATNASCLNLLNADFAMLNRPLAKHYGIPGPRGLDFERVQLQPEHRRGGLLTQGSVLLSNSTGEDSHPIRRAVWLLDRLLDSPPPPPPPDVPELNPDEPSLAGLSTKLQLEVHRKKEACNSCHRGIDPWGIPFENYDAVGRWRTEIRNLSRRGKVTTTPVAADSTLPGGHEVAGLAELKQYLLDHERERFARALVSKLLAYSSGRSLELTDQPTVDQLTADFAEQDYRLRELIVAIAGSKPFQTK